MTGSEPVEVRTLDSSRWAVVRRLLRDVVDRPTRLLREVNRAYHWRFGVRSYNPSGVDVVAEDWDTLVVLDACRYDMFAEHNTLPGRLESRTSRGANTFEFFRGNFDGRDLRDTVYVMANPRFFRRRGDIDVTFHDVVNVWRDGWNESERTVPPGTTTNYALEAAEAYPNKRLVVHYMQPHFPFVGSPIDTGEMIDERNPSVWDLVRAGDLDADEVRRAYDENLQITLAVVEDLLADLGGRTVVTADHGNMLGERASPLPVAEWGHPGGIHTPELLTVPWLVHESGPRRDVVAEDSGATERPDVTSQVLERRLEHLGYRS